MKASHVIAEAIEEIETNGWCQNSLRTPDGALCMVGALMTSAGMLTVRAGGRWAFSRPPRGYAAYMRASAHVQAAIAQDTPGMTHVPTFNDHVAQSAEDVILVMKHAREMALAESD